MTYLLAIDQGTTSSRTIIFDQQGNIVALSQKEFPQYFPQSGWVEHNAMEIWDSQLWTLREALRQAQLPVKAINAVGITNQRETTLVWDRRTGQPLHPALVWQDRRTQTYCEALSPAQQDLIRSHTGLRADPYFSATKLRWLLDYLPQGQQRAEAGELAFGTIDSWLIWQLTKGRVHATDHTNASRTMLYSLEHKNWDPHLLELFNIPDALLPSIQSSSDYYGDIDASWLGESLAIHGVAGDQQAALFGQACFEPGMVKNTYGTGCFMLMNIGNTPSPSAAGLITTATASTVLRPQYALEGSVFVGGAVVQWLRDKLGAIESSQHVESLTEAVDDAGGVIMVPAFTGLGAPYWQPQARGSILGISRGTTMAHIAYAALESIAFQSTALFQAMVRDASTLDQQVDALRVDGGASRNDRLMQMQADLLGLQVIRPKVTETTALGAAYLAGLSAGVYTDTQELTEQWQIEQRFYPKLSTTEREQRMAEWEHAVRQTCLPTADV